MKVVACGSLAVGLVPSHAAAQVELSLFGGVYAPLYDMGKHEFVVGIAEYGPDPTTRVDLKQEVGLAIGGRLTLWLGDHLGAEIGVTYTPSDIKAEQPFWPESRADLLMASARAIVRFASPVEPVSLHLLGGPGLIKRRGEAYDDHNDQEASEVSAALALGGGFRIRLGPKLLVRLDIENFLYSTDLTIPGSVQTGNGVNRSELQSDLVVAPALVLEF